jgi:hypothetical protein
MSYIKSTDNLVEGLSNLFFSASRAKSAVQSDLDSLSSRITSEVSRAQGAESTLSGRLDVVEGTGTGSIKKSLQDAKDYADAAVSVEAGARQSAVSAEQSRAQSAESALGGRLTVIEGSGTGSIAKSLVDAKAYADQKIADLVNGAPGMLDTLKEIADQLANDESAVSALTSTVAANLQTAKNYADAAVLVETQARQTAVSGEASARQSADSALSGRLEVLEGADSVSGSVAKSLKDAKAYADQKVSDEATARASAVSAEQSRAQGIEAGLRTDLTSEISRAQGVEGGLRTDLNAEISNRQSAVSAEQSRAQAVEANRLALDGSNSPSADIPFNGKAITNVKIQSTGGYLDFTGNIARANDASGVRSVGFNTRRLTDAAAADIMIWSSGLNFPQHTASTVPYMDSSKNLVSSSVTPTELGYLSGVTSGIQGQLNSEASARASAVSAEQTRAQAEEATMVKLDGSRAMTGLLTMNGGMNVQGPMYVKCGQRSASANLASTSGLYQGITSLSGGSVTLTLPQPSVGRMFVVKDQSGQCSQSTYIQINPYGSETIDGASNFKLVAPFEAVTLVCGDGSNWFIA